MKEYECYKKCKEKYKEYLILIKSGVFYRTYEEDTLIMNYIKDYKVINNKNVRGGVLLIN